MKFGPIIVTSLVVFTMGLTACQRKSAKDAAREGNQLSVESSQITEDLRVHHGLNVYQSGVPAQELQAKAAAKNWDGTSDADRKVIREKLNKLVAKIDRIFQIDRRKDIRINDNSGSLKTARENALTLLGSLDKHEKGLVAAPAPAPKKEEPFDQKEHERKRAESEKQGYGWGGPGTLPTLQ